MEHSRYPSNSRKVLLRSCPAEQQIRILNFIADLTARYYGGYQAVLATHAEGFLEALKMQIARSSDSSAAVNYVFRLAGIE
ncbi:4-hydroxyphenylacetate 3-hydroxylase C-terminal domain-containing protein [Mycobacterium sp. ITM-2016-00318]|uniref:4-hydroxyphenylacetate 3-hydroxylase C-terminal domain-containing protein n=1 Tax=Mycobacterium sp. ITM-2016-00318 TaxID=2099693 RepID=UPI002106D673|nr:4-hydroxyphenylacetate 3-hydroxylase C-terminal domain-containing protein [Mycobacterium sp. ITM-2016-00318]WNG95402.1 4-hydroxyphenylacetate 3-hydroxylase C-terminal domain-containing protein [Mycobacterium sp. ITM-2016-00318]